jgi:hypothetical protein
VICGDIFHEKVGATGEAGWQVCGEDGDIERSRFQRLIAGDELFVCE